MKGKSEKTAENATDMIQKLFKAQCDLSEENQELKETMVNMAVKLHGGK